MWPGGGSLKVQKTCGRYLYVPPLLDSSPDFTRKSHFRAKKPRETAEKKASDGATIYCPVAHYSYTGPPSMRLQNVFHSASRNLFFERTQGV